MKKFLPVVALSLLAAACTSSTPGGMSRWMEAYGNNFPVPKPGLAAVYLVRADAPPDAPAINITSSGRLAGMLTGQHLAALRPGARLPRLQGRRNAAKQ